MLDIIGDIHGHADALKKLLKKIGYEYKNGSYIHEKRKALFVGDYIDRGPQIPEVLQIVRSMVEAEAAIALLGNHEYNAICFHTKKEGGGHLRPHLIKNIKQHVETLLQFQNRQEEYNDYIEWFTSLPLWYEDEHIRAVHACWNKSNIERLGHLLGGNKLTKEKILDSTEENNELYRLIDETLKGIELSMPNDQWFYDKDGHKRNAIRVKWWLDPKVTTYKEISIVELDDRLPDEIAAISVNDFYREPEKPVFFGHYWLQGDPNLYRNNVCCLDYSIARGGYLTAYRYDGESILSKDKLVWV